MFDSQPEDYCYRCASIVKVMMEVEGSGDDKKFRFAFLVVTPVKLGCI